MALGETAPITVPPEQWPPGRLEFDITSNPFDIAPGVHLMPSPWHLKIIAAMVRLLHSWLAYRNLPGTVVGDTLFHNLQTSHVHTTGYTDRASADVGIWPHTFDTNSINSIDLAIHGLPCWVLEVVSATTWQVDVQDKLRLYQNMQIPEYWIYDPHNYAGIDFFQGWHLAPSGKYELVSPQLMGIMARLSGWYSPFLQAFWYLGQDEAHTLHLWDEQNQAEFHPDALLYAEGQREGALAMLLQCAFPFLDTDSQHWLRQELSQRDRKEWPDPVRLISVLTQSSPQAEPRILLRELLQAKGPD